jgi:hypothetical protein
MKKLPDNTNKNLVLNGDFQKAYDDWEDLNNPQGFQVKGDTWEGEPIRYAELKNEASVFQTMKVAVEPVAGARYHLRFLYQNTHKTAPGKVLIGKKGAGDVEKLSIDLPSTGGSTSAEPMAVDLHELARHLPLDLALHKGDDLDITLISPKRTPDDNSTADIRLTRIELHVELVPLQLLGLFHDNQRFDAGQVLHLCLGAEKEQRHQLKFEVLPDSEWAGTDALLWSEDNPQEAIITSPDLGVNQSIELPWLLDCPVLEGEAPYLFDLNIYSHYTAEPYPVAVSLGHHRLTLNVLKGATFWPVLEYGQTLPFQVQVLSHYTGLPVAGVEVSWHLGEDLLHSGISDGEGKAGFDYIPGVDGLQIIDVSVPSPYYNDPVVRESLDVLVLRDDPLKAVKVRFERMEATAWGEKTGYPDRGSSYAFSLIFPAGSPLLGAKIAVGWREGGYDPEDLDVRSVPGFGELAQVTGDELEWTLVCGDVLDAPFGLFLSCPMLQRESRDNAMSLARNNLKIGEVREANKSPAVDEGDSVYCMVQVLTLNNEPALNVQVDWVLSHGTFTSYTGVGGWASAFDKPTVAGPYAMVAQIKVREGAPPLSHSFPIVALATSEWKDDIDFVFDQTIIDSQGMGILCWRGGSHTFSIVPKHSGSPFIGQMISLNWRNGVEPDLGLVFSPPFGSKVLLTQEGVQWSITSGNARSGIFELEVESDYLPRKRELTGRLMATQFDDEVTLVFDQMTSPIGRSDLHPCIGAIHQLTLLPHAFSPLQGVEVLWGNSPTAPLPENIEITPGLRSSVPITAGGVRYTFDCSASSGKTPLSISYSLRKLQFRTSDQLFKLDHNKLKLGAVRQAAIDPVLSNAERAWLQIQYLSWFTDLPVPGMPVQWSDAKSQLARSETDAEGWAGHDYEPLVPGPNTVNAQVVNLYDGSSAGDDFEVLALDSDPWLGLGVKTIDTPDAHAWAEKTFFPRRSGQFDFVLSANEDSYLHGRDLALGITGAGPGELGLSMGPVTFGQWRTLVDELPCTLTAGDEKDGGFSLQWAASRLLARSPRNAVSLGAGTRAIKMSAINSSMQVIDWGSMVECQVTIRSALSGKPVVGMVVEWDGPELERVSTVTNFYGVASVRFMPAFTGLGQVTATAGDNTLSLSYRVNEPREILEITSPDLVGYPGEEVGAQVTVVGAGGKVLSDVEVMWRFQGVELTPTMTGTDGKAIIRFKLPFIQGDGALTASVRGGEEGWVAERLVFTVLEDEWVVGDVSSDSSDVYLGESMTAEAKVVTRQHGIAVGDAEVSWRFPLLELLPSHTDAQGVATIELKPVQLGQHDLIASVDNGTPSSKGLVVKVLDPATSPKHATIKSVVASRDSITPRETVVFTAVIVSTVTQEPMPGREVFLSLNEGEYIPVVTDIRGEVSRIVGGGGGASDGICQFLYRSQKPGWHNADTREDSCR